MKDHHYPYPILLQLCQVNPSKTGIRKVIANFWTINDPPGLQGLKVMTRLLNFNTFYTEEIDFSKCHVTLQKWLHYPLGVITPSLRTTGLDAVYISCVHIWPYRGGAVLLPVGHGVGLLALEHGLVCPFAIWPSVFRGGW